MTKEEYYAVFERERKISSLLYFGIPRWMAEQCIEGRENNRTPTSPALRRLGPPPATITGPHFDHIPVAARRETRIHRWGRYIALSQAFAFAASVVLADARGMIASFLAMTFFALLFCYEPEKRDPSTWEPETMEDACGMTDEEWDYYLARGGGPTMSESEYREYTHGG